MQLKKYWLIIPILLALAFHFPALLCGFVWDDVTLVQTNPHLGETPLADFFSQDYGLHLGPRIPVGYYRPSFVAAVALLYRIGGPSPVLFHAFSMLIFCAATALVSLVARQCLQNRSYLLPIIAGCIYAAHPARTEVVALVMSLPDLIVECCCMLIILLMLKLMSKSAKPTGLSLSLLYLGVFAAGLLAVTSKESAFFALAGLGCCAVAHIFVSKPRNRLGVCLPIGIASAILCGLLLNTVAGIQRPSLISYLRILLTTGSESALKITGFALRDLLLPMPPVFMESVQATGGIASSTGIVLLLAALGIAALALCRRSLPACLLFGWFAAGLCSLMLIAAVNVPYSQRYVPVAPAVLLLGMLFDRFPRFTARRVFKYVAIFYITALGAFTLGGTIKCRDNLTFFTFMADERPDLVYPRLYLVDRLFHEYKNYELMEIHALRGIEIEPESDESATLRKFLARKRIMERQYAEALALLEDAENIIRKDDSELLWLKAICLLETGDRTGAKQLLERCIAVDPGNQEYGSMLRRLE